MWFFLFIVVTEVALVYMFVYEMIRLVEMTEDDRWQSTPENITHVVVIFYTMLVTLFSIPLM